MLDSFRTTLFHLFLLSMFFLFLLFPIPTLNGAASGLLLWYKILLPSLLPFIILTTIIIKTQAFSIIGRIIGPFLGKIFRVSNDSSIAIIVGFLCGYPMGAKTISELYDNHSITEKEGQYLLSFCNNTSPMFIISFFLLQILGNTSLLTCTLLSLYLSPFLVSLITRNYYHIPIPNNKQTIVKGCTSRKFSFQLLDEVMIESITLIMKIGGYVMLFSIFINLLVPFVKNYIPCFLILIPLLEITNGLEMYHNMSLSIPTYYLMIFLISFGGFCAIGQTRCVVTTHKIKMSHYFMQKIITAIIAVIISISYVHLFVISIV